MKNPIVQEIRKIRDTHAAKFGGDTHAMGNDLRKREKQSGRKMASVKIRRIA